MSNPLQDIFQAAVVAEAQMYCAQDGKGSLQTLSELERGAYIEKARRALAHDLAMQGIV